MSNLMVSVIVPVYNVEAYLKECIDSILSQSYEKTEIILIDDGSKDSSGEICDAYAAQYNNVQVVHQENAGLAAARNVGIRCAKGDYLLFVDSDDYIAEGALKKIIYESMSMDPPPDVVFLEMKNVYPDGTEKFSGEKYDRRMINGQPKEMVLRHLAKIGKFPGSSCNKMVKRSLLADHNILFPEGLLAEDIDWILQLLEVAESFFYCDLDYYYYRKKREGSITNTAGIKTVKSLLKILEKWFERSGSIKYQDCFNAFLAYEYMVMLCTYGTLRKEEKSDIKQKAHNARWIMRYAKGKKEKITAVVIGLLGVELTAWLLAKYNAIRQ